MSLQPAKCPNCGAILKIDTNKDAGICEYCGTPFITEKAINNYITNIKNEFNIENANISVTGKSYRTIRLYSLLKTSFDIYVDDKFFLTVDNLDIDGSITFEIDTERHLISFVNKTDKSKLYVIERGTNNLSALLTSIFIFELFNDKNSAKIKYENYILEQHHRSEQNKIRSEYDQISKNYNELKKKQKEAESSIKFSILPIIILSLAIVAIVIVAVVFAINGNGDSDYTYLLCLLMPAIFIIVFIIMRQYYKKKLIEINHELENLESKKEELNKKTNY